MAEADMGPVLVVGVRGGVGAGVAEQLIRQGRSVIGTVRRPMQRDEVSAALPGIAEVLAFDMADPEQTRKELAERFGSAELSGVIVCAAVSDYGPLELASITDFKRIMDV